MDAEIRSMVDDLEIAVLARNATIGDLQHDCLHAARCDMKNSHPNWGYVRAVLAAGLDRPIKR